MQVFPGGTLKKESRPLERQNTFIDVDSDDSDLPLPKYAKVERDDDARTKIESDVDDFDTEISNLTKQNQTPRQPEKNALIAELKAAIKKGIPARSPKYTDVIASVFKRHAAFLIVVT